MRARVIVPILCPAVVLAALLIGCDTGAKQLSPDEIVTAFITQNAEADRAFHMDWQGSMRMQADPQMGGNIPINLTGSFDFSGDDFAGTVTSGTDGQGPGMGGFRSSTSYARVDGASFIRYEGSDWQRTDEDIGDGGVSAPDFDPMRSLTAADVAYERAETIDDRPLHVIRVLDPSAAMTRAFDSGTGVTLQADPAGSDLVLYLDPEGVPVGAQVRLDARISMGDLGPEFNRPPMHYQLSFTYQFSAWGSEIAIAPPI